MKRNAKLVITLIITLITLLSSILIQPCYADSDDDYSILEYNIYAMVLENGNLYVIEDLTYQFYEDMNGLVRNILYSYSGNDTKDNMEPTSSRYQAEDIQNLYVYVSDKPGVDNLQAVDYARSAEIGDDGVYTLSKINEKDKQGYGIKVYSPVKAGKKKYVSYEYEIVNPCVKYNDVGELYYNFIGGDWEKDIGYASVNILFENEDISFSDVKVYPHTYAEEITSVGEVEGFLCFEVTNLPANTAVDARIVFPKDAIPDAEKVYQENYNYQELEKIEEREAFAKTRNKIANYSYLGLVIVATIFFIYIIIKAKHKVKGIRIKERKADYDRDIPNRLPLGEYSTILYRSLGYTDTRLFLATILDLVNKKVLFMESKKKEKKSALTKVEYDYHLKLNPEIKELEKLEPYEKVVLNILLGSKVDEQINRNELENKEVELNESLKKFSKSQANKTKLQKLSGEYAKEKNKKIYENKDKKIKKEFFIGCFIFILIFLILFFIVSPLKFAAKDYILIIGGILAFFYTLFGYIYIFNILELPKEEYLEDYKQIVGLKRYLKDYSKIKDRYPMEIALWDDYLVFAALFGIADKVSKEIKEELVKQGYDDNYIYMTYPIICMSHESQSVTGYVSNYTGSSSGGYSGGGSGGRRRPVVEAAEPSKRK